MPVVIFTRDIVMRAVITDQLLHAAAGGDRAGHAGGVEFRFVQRRRSGRPGPFSLARRRRRGGLRLHQSRYPARAAPHRERDQLPRLHRFPLSAGALPGALERQVRRRYRDDPFRCPPARRKPGGTRRRSDLLRARRELCRADQRADRHELDAADRLPPRGRRRLHGGGRRPAAQPRRLLHRLARSGPVQRDGVAALGVSRRDADGDAGGPGRAQGFRPPWRCRSRTTPGCCPT